MSGFDPTNRELCADGACIGVIGSDGTCRECGAVARSVTTHSRLRGMRLPDRAESESTDDDDDRQLCPDDMCVGLIGSDGRCKECGAAAATPDEDESDDSWDADEDDYGDEDEDIAEDDDGEGYDDDRRLCSDDMCIGLIGSNGRCKECGSVGVSSGS